MSNDNNRVLIIGATGMLGRPVVRRLLQDNFPIRAMVRNPNKARALLPSEVDVVEGNLESISSIEKALEGCGAVYVSVDTHPKSKFRPETDGLKNVVAAARTHNHPRLMVLSAFGQSQLEAKNHSWWHVREKYEAQMITKSSGLPWTIFEPTWFSESLPLFVKGKTFSTFSQSHMKPYWVAGDDYARIISSALKQKAALEKNIPVQGPESLTLKEAGARFIKAFDPKIKMKTVPLLLLKMAGIFSIQARDFVTLLNMSGSFAEPPPNPHLFPGCPAPSMTVEAYAGYCRATGDFPQKN